MIYQLYPNSNFQCKPFSKYYSCVCLDCLNEDCLPQLKMEYSGMIYLWKNNIDDDNWIGFTSYRQKDKSSFILDDSNINNTLLLLQKYDIFCFHYLKFNSTISKQAESCHPKINKHIQYLFKEIYIEKIPDEFYTNKCGCFANYWIMSKNNFNEFMNWSYPKVLKIVELSKTQEYFSLGRHTSNSGYIIERLFILWYMIYTKTICN